MIGRVWIKLFDQLLGEWKYIKINNFVFVTDGKAVQLDIKLRVANFWIEGACKEGGRGSCMWDAFSHIEGMRTFSLLLIDYGTLHYSFYLWHSFMLNYLDCFYWEKFLTKAMVMVLLIISIWGCSVTIFFYIRFTSF